MRNLPAYETFIGESKDEMSAALTKMGFTSVKARPGRDNSTEYEFSNRKGARFSFQVAKDYELMYIDGSHPRAGDDYLGTLADDQAYSEGMKVTPGTVSVFLKTAVNWPAGVNESVLAESAAGHVAVCNESASVPSTERKKAAAVVSAAEALIAKPSDKKVARAYMDAMTACLGMGWHPDNSASEYIYHTVPGDPKVFTKEQCGPVDKAMEICFDVFGDPYKEGMESWRRAGLKMFGESSGPVREQRVGAGLDETSRKRMSASKEAAKALYTVGQIARMGPEIGPNERKMVADIMKRLDNLVESLSHPDNDGN